MDVCRWLFFIVPSCWKDFWVTSVIQLSSIYSAVWTFTKRKMPTYMIPKKNIISMIAWSTNILLRICLNFRYLHLFFLSWFFSEYEFLVATNDVWTEDQRYSVLLQQIPWKEQNKYCLSFGLPYFVYRPLDLYIQRSQTLNVQTETIFNKPMRTWLGKWRVAGSSPARTSHTECGLVTGELNP